MLKNLYMENIGKKAKIASNELSNLNVKKRNDVLKIFYKYLMFRLHIFPTKKA